MIKIELTEVESTCADSLKLTGEYLIKMAELRMDYSKVSNEANSDLMADEAEVLPVETSDPEQEEPAPEPEQEKPAPEVTTIQDETQITLPSPAEIFAKPEVPPAPAVEVDAEGLPWDKRIHSRTRSKVKDGTWKKQRNLGPDVIARVEGELRQIMNLPPAPPPPPRPIFRVAPPPPTPVKMSPFAAAIAQAEAQANAPTPPDPENPRGLTAPDELDAHIPDLPEVTFMDLMSFVTSSIVAGTLHREGLTDLLKPFGIPALPLVANRPDLIPLVMHAAQEAVAKAKANAQ